MMFREDEQEVNMAISNELYDAVLLMQQGNEQGFNQVYSQTYNYIFFRAKYIMQDEQDAIDLVQETYIQAFNNIGKLEDPNNIYEWLGAITYNHGMRIFRKKKEVLLDEESEGLLDIIEDEHIEWSPEESTDKNETASILMNIIDELPPLQKAALVAFYYDNMKIDDIAKAEGCSSNTIKSRLNYAKKYIKNRVEEMQKQGGYKLYSINIPAVLMAIWLLSNKTSNNLSTTVASNVYQATKYKILSYASQSNVSCGLQDATQGNVQGGLQGVTQSGLENVTSGAVKVAKKGASFGKIMAGIGLTAAIATGGVVGYDAVTGEPFGIFIDKITDEDMKAAVGMYTGHTRYLFVLESDVLLTIGYEGDNELNVNVQLDNKSSVLNETMDKVFIDGDKVRFERTTDVDYYEGYITLEDDGTVKFYFTISGREGSPWGKTKVIVSEGAVLNLIK